MVLDSKPISQLYLVLALLFIFLVVGVPLPCSGDENVVEYAGIVREDLVDESGCVSSYGEAVDSVRGVRRGSVGCTELVRACAHSDSFCFLSTLPASLFEGDDCKGVPLKALGSPTGGIDIDLEPDGGRVHELLYGKMVSCSLIGGKDEKDAGLSFQEERPIPPDAWMQEASGTLNVNPAEMKSNLEDPSLAQHVDIRPPFLDWGRKHLYSPSFAYLIVTNTHNGSRLNVHEPSSTDSQFYPHDFMELSLAPGEATTIKFVFLPRRVGSLSAHVVLEISFGGQSSSDVFIINVRGAADESPFKIQPLVGFDFSGNGLFAKGLSLYNPFDEAIIIEEVTLRLSLASGNQCDYLQVSCQHMDSMQQSYGGINAQTNVFHEYEKGYDELLVEMRPHGKWEILSHVSETILNISLEAYKERNVSGVFCINLKHSSSDGNRIETIIFPLEIRKHQSAGYRNSSGSLSVFLDPFVLSENENSILIVSLRNDASELLSVLEISENSARKKLFGVKYANGLILYPGSLTRIASVTCPLQDESTENLKGNSDCKLRILTNDSIQYVDIPCRELQPACARQSPQSQSYPSSESSESTNNEKLLTKKLLQSRFSEILEANEFIFRNWRSQGVLSGSILLEQKELIFSKVEVGHECPKWIRVKNPSQQPVVVQLLLNSEAMVHLCKPADNVLHQVSGHDAHPESMGILHQFFLPKSAITEAFVHPSESINLGPIVFRPSDRCTWRSSALIKNNLSGVEWLSICGNGASSLVRLLEDSRATCKLDFYLNWSIPLDILSADTKFLDGNVSFSCGKLLSKKLQVKNVGDLTLEVSKLQLSGISCELDGFTLHTCKGFALSPGESESLHISYRPDFSASVINRDLELILPSGTIVVPMKATIPVFMMKLCRKSYLWSFLRMLLSLVLIGIFISGLLSIMPYLVIKRSADHMVKSNTISTINEAGRMARINRHPKHIRAPKEELKSDLVIIRRYSDAEDEAQDVTDAVQPRKDMDCEERNLPSPTSSELRSSGESRSNISDVSKPANLTIKTRKEKERRRKRRTSGLGSGLASKSEVCSSQSGNSTPSSPLSPNTFTPKQVRPSSPDTSDYFFVRESVERNCKTLKGRGSSPQGDKCPDHGECHDNLRQVFHHEQVSLPQRPTTKPFLTPSASFPRSSLCAPGVATPIFLSSASPIAPYARAPGSNLGRDKIKRNEEPTISKEFTYDIWGNHLSDHIMGRSKEHLPKAFVETSEGDSLSFFARGPQSLMKMSSLRSISPDPKLPSYDVSHNHHPIV